MYIAGVNKRRVQGFTLYELLITVVIVGIVLGFGIPNFRAFTQNSRMAAATNDMLGTFHLARSEAARSKQNVSICASTDPLAAVPSCGGTFEDGWIVFVDPDGDVEFDAGEILLRSYPALPDAITVTNTGQGGYFAFGPSGQSRGAVLAQPPTTTAVFCDARGNAPTTAENSAARVLRVLPIGRATILRTVAQVSTYGGCP